MMFSAVVTPDRVARGAATGGGAVVGGGKREGKDVRTALLIAAGVSALAVSPAFAADLSCSAVAGGPAFKVTEVTEVPAAATKSAGSEKCDIVYHIDGSRYELGGCNREYVGLWSPREGTPLRHQHARLPLVCK
jgi:hypothetical protein